MLRQPIYKVNRLKEQFTYVPQRKQTHQVFGNCKNVSMAYPMPVDTGTFVSEKN